MKAVCEWLCVAVMLIVTSGLMVAGVVWAVKPACDFYDATMPSQQCK